MTWSIWGKNFRKENSLAEINLVELLIIFFLLGMSFSFFLERLRELTKILLPFNTWLNLGIYLIIMIGYALFWVWFVKNPVYNFSKERWRVIIK